MTMSSFPGPGVGFLPLFYFNEILNFLHYVYLVNYITDFVILPELRRDSVVTITGGIKGDIVLTTLVR